MAFVEIELEVRKYLHVNNVTGIIAGLWDTTMNSVVARDDALFHWYMVACDVSEMYQKSFEHL